MKNLKHFFFSFLAALMVTLACAGPASGIDGGDGDEAGDDGGLDDGGDDPDGTRPDDSGDHGHSGDGDGGDGRGHHGGDGGDRHHGHHGGHHGYHGGYGWGWGPGFGPSGFGAFGYFPPYYPPFYGYSRIAVQPTAPPVYIEQQNPPAASVPGAAYWHYCQAEGGYYPDVKECPEGWMQIPRQNQSASPQQP